jgi:hypothetical protein
MEQCLTTTPAILDTPPGIAAGTGVLFTGTEDLGLTVLLDTGAALTGQVIMPDTMQACTILTDMATGATMIIITTVTTAATTIMDRVAQWGAL